MTWEDYNELRDIYNMSLNYLYDRREVEYIQQLLQGVQSDTDAANVYYQISAYIWEAKESQ